MNCLFDSWKTAAVLKCHIFVKNSGIIFQNWLEVFADVSNSLWQKIKARQVATTRGNSSSFPRTVRQLATAFCVCDRIMSCRTCHYSTMAYKVCIPVDRSFEARRCEMGIISMTPADCAKILLIWSFIPRNWKICINKHLRIHYRPMLCIYRCIILRKLRAWILRWPSLIWFCYQPRSDSDNPALRPAIN